MEINKQILLNLINKSYNKPIVEDYQIIEDTIVSNDPEDGGAVYRVIIKNIKQNKYFEVIYCDWDKQNEFEDLDNEILEVIPVEELITTYKLKI